jgi:hypothetical protein
MRDVAEKTDNESLGCMRMQRRWVNEEENDHEGDAERKTARTASSERVVKVSRLLDTHANLLMAFSLMPLFPRDRRFPRESSLPR